MPFSPSRMPASIEMSIKQVVCLHFIHTLVPFSIFWNFGIFLKISHFLTWSFLAGVRDIFLLYLLDCSSDTFNFYFADAPLVILRLPPSENKRDCDQKMSKISENWWENSGKFPK